jgi:hypothetical protein
MKRMIIAGVPVVCGVLLLIALSPRTTAGQALGSFGIRPTQTESGDPATGAYFTYDLSGGARRADEAFVVNNASDPVTLALFPADGTTAINGGTAFAAADENRNGVRTWLSLDTTEISLEPGESALVPFTVAVPADAAPGDHVAGLVLEAPPKAAPAGGFGAAVIERVGVAVVVHVPGPAEKSLTLGEICLNQETGSNYFQIPVTNTGDLLTHATGTMRLGMADGTDVFTRDVTLDTVLPGDRTAIRVDAPFDPGPGSYVANLILTRDDGRDLESASVVTIGEAKVNGCGTAVADENQQPDQEDGPRPPGITDDEDGGNHWLVVILGAVIAALLAALAVREIVWRRRRQST